MDWRAWLFRLGRTSGRLKMQVGGRLLAPASVQRAYTGIRDISPSTGIVRLRSGEVRVFLALDGITLHHQSPQAAHAFLVQWAGVLNSMPPNVVCLARSRAGLGHARAALAAQWAQADALALRQPQSGLARLAQSQKTHVQALAQAGVLHQIDFYVAIREPAGNAEVALRTMETVRRKYADAGLRGPNGASGPQVVTHQHLAEALSSTWEARSPQLFEVTFPDEVLSYDQRNALPARITPPPTPPQATVTPMIPKRRALLHS